MTNKHSKKCLTYVLILWTTPVCGQFLLPHIGCSAQDATDYAAHFNEGQSLMQQLHYHQATDEILERLSERLNSNGIFVSHCHMGWWRPGDSEEHMFRAWFREHGFVIYVERVDRSDRPEKNSGRVALLSYSTG
jgi:hypothetical protein